LGFHLWRIQLAGYILGFHPHGILLANYQTKLYSTQANTKDLQNRKRNNKKKDKQTYLLLFAS
jgi:hypothetical protein